MAETRQWTVAPGEEARLSEGGAGDARIESRGTLPLRCRSKLHPGSAVVLGQSTYEVVAEQRAEGGCAYELQPWPRDQAIRDRVVYGPRLVRAAQEQRRQESRERWAGPALRAVRVVLDAFVALLPSTERRAASERLSLDPMRGTWLLCAFQLFGGALLWALGFVAAGQARLESVAGSYTRGGSAPSDREISQAYAPFKGGAETWSPEGLRFLAYAFTPQGLVLEYAFLTGLLRALHAVTSRQPLGDPFLSLLLFGVRGGRTRRREHEREARLGPERPDRVQSDGDDLLVLSARDKPEWDEHATIQIGERFYRLRDVSERPDATWRVLAYRLRPLEAGVVVRGLVHYEAPVRPGERPRPRPQPQPPAEPPQQSRGVPERQEWPKARTGGRQRFTIEEGEEARLTPEGSAAAVIESLGSLPLRPRSEALGVHHRPEFPGTCVVLGDARYEVVQEQAMETGFRYLLEPWPGEQVQRDAIVYGPALVRRAQRERRRALERERASRFSSVLYPFVGLLPEERQLLACDRFGLDAQVSTLAGVGLEIGAALMLALSLPAKSAAPLGPLYVIAGLVVAPALYRMLGALLFNEVAGSPLLSLLLALRDSPGASPTRSDPSVLPLTRDAFWSRLQRPDRHERQPDGSLIVKSLLPHLTWGYSALNPALAGVAQTVRAGDDHWRVMPLAPTVDQGRLLHGYQLVPMREPEMRQDLPDPVPPDPRQYQNEVLEQVSREWDDVFGAAPWLPSLLPREAQERAYRGRGGVTASLRSTVLTASVSLLAGLWFLFGRGAFNLLTGLVLAGDAAWRLWRATDGKFAPSLIGLAISDYLRPERVAYQAHLQAERLALGRSHAADGDPAQ